MTKARADPRICEIEHPRCKSSVGVFVWCEFNRDGTAAVPYGVTYGARFLLPIGSSPKLATPQSASLTAPLRGAPRGAVRCLCANAESSPRSAAPSRGSPQCAHWGKGSPESRLKQGEKESPHRTSIVGDGLCAVPLCVLHSMKIGTPD